MEPNRHALRDPRAPFRVSAARALRLARTGINESGVPRIYVIFIASENIGGRVRFEGTGHSMLMLMLSGQPAHQCGRGSRLALLDSPPKPNK